MKKKCNLWKRADIRIRRYCRKLPQRRRAAFVTTAFVLFMTGCLYMIITALSGFGKPDGSWEIKHIRLLDMKLERDTIIHFKDIQDYGHPENKDTVRLVG